MQVVEPTVAHLPAPLFYGTHAHRARSQGEAPSSQGAIPAPGLRGGTLQSPEIHDRLVVACRPTPVELFVGKRGERFAALGGVDGQIEVEEP